LEGQVLFAAGIVWAPREHSSMAASPDLRCPASEVSDPPVSSPSRGGQCLGLSLTVESGPGSMRACEPWPLLLLLLCSPVRRRVPTHPSRLQSRSHPRLRSPSHPRRRSRRPARRRCPPMFSNSGTSGCNAPQLPPKPTSAVPAPRKPWPMLLFNAARHRSSLLRARSTGNSARTEPTECWSRSGRPTAPTLSEPSSSLEPLSRRGSYEWRRSNNEVTRWLRPGRVRPCL
jgi:hypothetical protein